MARSRPNIVVLMADDHRGTALRHLGDAQVSTPVLDALAARGVSFSGAHCQGSMHGAVCVPSRASLMTGRSIFASSCDPTGHDGRSAMTIPPALETFPQAMRAAGYRTHAVGKWHNDPASFNRSFASGEALMFGGMSDHHHVPLRSYDETGAYPDEDIVEGDGFSTDIFTDAAIRFLDDAGDADDPFLLYVAFTAPHDPRTPPAGWRPAPAGIELPPNLLPAHPFDNGEMSVRDELLAAMPRDPQEVREHIADYYGMIAHLDMSIGRILDAIRANGLDRETVVLYTADHGLAVGQHGLMGKQNLYEHSIRVPLILAGPGVPPAGVVGGLHWHADTTATLRALAGLDPDPAGEGTPLFDDTGNIAAGRPHLGAAYDYGQRMYRNDRYKLIRYWPIPDGVGRPGTTAGTDTMQLFDLREDPWEMANRADDPSLQSIRRDLEDGLRAWQEAINDPLLAVQSRD